MTVGAFLKWLEENDVPSKAIIYLAPAGYDYQTFDSDQLNYDAEDKILDITFPL